MSFSSLAFPLPRKSHNCPRIGGNGGNGGISNVELPEEKLYGRKEEKVRLVAKGFTQTYVIDYEEASAPVAKMKSVRLQLFSIAANRDWPLFQLNVKNAFLNGDLQE